jgi:hypothetical protein
MQVTELVLGIYSSYTCLDQLLFRAVVEEYLLQRYHLLALTNTYVAVLLIRAMLSGMVKAVQLSGVRITSLQECLCHLLLVDR